MRISTFNVEFLFSAGEHNHSGHMWTYTPEYVSARMDHLAAQFAKINADILFLNEIASKEVLEKIIAKCGIDYKYFIANPDRNGIGNAVIFKDKNCICESIPAVSAMPVMMVGDTDVIGPRIYSRRDFVHLTTTFNEKPLDIFGLHLKARWMIREKNENMTDRPIKTELEAADGMIRSEMFTLAQARRMRELVSETFIADKKAQVAVLGDFNAQERDPAMRIIRGELSNREDSLVEPPKNVATDRRYSFYGTHGRKQIDHILLSRSLAERVKSFDILNENLSYHSNKPPFPNAIESDHAPLMVELV